MTYDLAELLTCIEHSEIQQLANLKVPPDPELVLWVDLTDWHPFMVCTDSSEFAVREACARRRE